MLRFPYAVLSKRNSDLSTDQGETANVERPLQLVTYRILSVSTTKGGGNNERFVLLVSFDAG